MLHAGLNAGGGDVLDPLPVVAARADAVDDGELTAGAHADFISGRKAGPRDGLGDLGEIVDVAGQHGDGDVRVIDVRERGEGDGRRQGERVAHRKRGAVAGGEGRGDEEPRQAGGIVPERARLDRFEICGEVQIRQGVRGIEDHVGQRVRRAVGEIQILEDVEVREGVDAEGGNGRGHLVIRAGTGGGVVEELRAVFVEEHAVHGGEGRIVLRHRIALQRTHIVIVEDVAQRAQGGGKNDLLELRVCLVALIDELFDGGHALLEDEPSYAVAVDVDRVGAL